jgi:F-type H+-transporting ATPase subunit delta
MGSTRRIRRTARELFQLCASGGELDQGRVRMIAGRLAESPRRGAIQALEAFQRLVRLERGRRTAKIESAAPLGDAERATILSELARRYGSTLETVFAENPALIGGVRITVGSDVFDGSIRARLAAIQSRL